ncbi:ABC transporter permease subunit [Alkalimarinus sediminis]|uniref:ABC transporter permease subunit n=1 Tax=Alkalimarinus sediminis TaxID=1632866 RepID=A0A9E8HPB1_9ALTE|nr:ABC transporter permease subunit [Alkalimarinus sediminis]UZW74006.1 ABC transporter permease subunit [Alkalimarinus sediminis]
MNDQAVKSTPKLDFETPQLLRYRKLRTIKDKAARVSIGMGGVSVIVAITLIFFYLLYEVMPLFQSANMSQVTQYELPGKDHDIAGSTVYLAMEEQAEKGIRITHLGDVVFFNVQDGTTVSTQRLPMPNGVEITSFSEADTGNHLVIAGLSNGTAILFKHRYKMTFPDGVRVITPMIEYPYGAEPIVLDDDGVAIKHSVLRDSESAMFVVGVNEQNELFSTYFSKEEDFLSGDITLERSTVTMPRVNGDIVDMQLGPDLRWLYLATSKGKLDVYDLFDHQNPLLNSRVDLTEGQHQITSLELLLGGISVLAADSSGSISQWFMVRDDSNEFSLKKIRTFEHGDAAITGIAPEHRRKGFVVSDEQGHVSIFNATAHRMLLDEKVSDGKVSHITIAPRANFLIFENAQSQMVLWQVDNEHPEVSWQALWEEVWYEGYQESDYIWQSSAANNDFEPKYSLMPLAFGTLKAAFYAMLIATPLAICGALYTAYFMAPRLRRKVKPAIELMEALPTVILGFLAGLFFAPFMEVHLPGIFSWLLITPISIVVFGYVWANLPESIRHKIPEGWDPLLLVPWIAVVSWFCFEISPVLELWFFNGDMRSWLTNDLGIDFDQRNALVVGAAMGFAVIPTIFSITEDAIFSVPKHLSYGSLALGATPWQTMVRVILPTASPGIFSAVMIGMGRAVGETMIVLMATGNTPIMDVNIFEGMRTLSANIAVEMPESEVGGTHYRILFLAAFVLFLFTFVVNTLAEYVRQRLRNKYSVI